MDGRDRKKDNGYQGLKELRKIEGTTTAEAKDRENGLKREKEGQMIP